MNLTAANQLTITRIILIPAFVILLIYGYRGWALVTFFTAGLTDLLDGLIARMTGQKTTLGTWLDPMADKLLLVTMFVMLTLPDIGSANRLPLWFTVLVISRDVAIVATVAVFNLAVAVFQLPGHPVRHRPAAHLCVGGDYADFGRPLRPPGHQAAALGSTPTVLPVWLR
jgi:cardiolipin synthase